MRRSARAAFVAFVLALVVNPLPAAAEDDVSPPVGTFTIGDGSGFSSSLTVTLHAPATDDVGVTTLRILVNGSVVDERAYVENVEWTFSQPQIWYVGVEWRDAAGNASGASADVTVDTTAPAIGQLVFPSASTPSNLTIPVRVDAADDGSPIDAVRLKTGSGAWGAPIPVPHGTHPVEVQWPAFDPAFGGLARFGPRTVYAQARNAAGLWSTSTSAAHNLYAPNGSLTVTGDVRTGHAVTIKPTLPAGVTFPAATECWWELYWGNDRSLYGGDRDDTFGGITISGPPSKGYCTAWTVTLPWVPHRQFLASFRADLNGEPLSEQSLGTNGPSDPTALQPAVDSTSRHITTSSLPMVYVLPDDYQLVVGQPATYRAYALAGAAFSTSDVWSVAYPDNPYIRYGGSVFTFTPTQTGYLTVCWSRATTATYQMSACYDPPSRYADTTRPDTTAPIQRLVGGTAGTTVPVRLTWSGTDKGWGIASYRLERSVNGGAWTQVPLATATTRTITQQLKVGTSYRYRVRARDKAGNFGLWDYGSTFKPRMVSDASAAVSFSSGWTTVSDATALGGSLRETGTAGRTTRLTFTGRDVAWIAERGPGHGKAQVYIDGVLAGTVDLAAASDLPRRVVFARHWSTAGTHQIRIVASGTGGRPLVSVDGFAILR